VTAFSSAFASIFVLVPIILLPPEIALTLSIRHILRPSLDGLLSPQLAPPGAYGPFPSLFRPVEECVLAEGANVVFLGRALRLGLAGRTGVAGTRPSREEAHGRREQEIGVRDVRLEGVTQSADESGRAI
jgi:hypothetical protein